MLIWNHTRNQVYFSQNGIKIIAIVTTYLANIAKLDYYYDTIKITTVCISRLQ